MVSGTNTTLDLHLLERVGLLVLLGRLLLLAASLEADHGLEHDVLTQRRGVSGARRLARLQADLGPCAALGDARVLLLLDDGAADALRALDLLAVLIDEYGHDGLGAVLVLRDLRRGDGGGEVGLAVFGPVDGFLCVCRHDCGCVMSERGEPGRELKPAGVCSQKAVPAKAPQQLSSAKPWSCGAGVVVSSLEPFLCL